MRIRLLKKLITPHARYGIMTILNYAKGPAERLISEGKAEKYTGVYPPPKRKIKTDFFKPKNNGNN